MLMPQDWFTQADNAHLAALSGLTEDPGDALSLATATVAHVLVPLARRSVPTDALFSNAVGGTACFSLAHRHLRACLLLLHFGYYESVAPILRAAYEAAECGQYLSKDPEAADRWVTRKTSWPNREVRGRLGEVTKGSPYGRYYGLVSALTHPTAKAAMATTAIDDQHLRATILRAEPDEAQIRDTSLAVAATAIFTCFALINANPPDAMEPQWREGLRDLAQALVDLGGLNDDLSHLDEDYGAAQSRWDQIAEQMRPASELEEALDAHRHSWRRARRAAGLTGPDEM